MSGIDFVADTNAVVYLLAGNSCMAPYLQSRLGVLELLSWPGITSHEEERIRAFLRDCEVLQIDNAVMEGAIALRRSRRVKLPDAIISATAIAQGVPLVTADVRLSGVPGLRLELLEPEPQDPQAGT